MATHDLSPRALNLLGSLVNRYIRDGQPVGSRTLSKDKQVALSPATIRNVMADLEDLGLIISPHTSAGRVPTVRGYRLFVDTLLQIKPLNPLDIQQLRTGLLPERDHSDQGLITHASTLLSEITNLAGVVMMPKQDSQTLCHLEFVPLSDCRILVVMVINEADVQNRIIETERNYTASELQSISNYLNESFAGKNLRVVRAQLVKDLDNAHQDMDAMMKSAVEVASQALNVTKEATSDYVLAGQTNLMAANDLSDMGKLRELFEAFNQKRDILHLLDQSLNAQGVHIFIGEESGYKMLDEYSVVTSPYQVDGEVLGVLGVIGPTRMAYERVIPIVDITAKLLGSALRRA
jgi:heat-inducible transcriptional repressor